MCFSCAARSRPVQPAMISWRTRSGRMISVVIVLVESEILYLVSVRLVHAPLDDPEFAPVDVAIQEHRSWRADLTGLVVPGLRLHLQAHGRGSDGRKRHSVELVLVDGIRSRNRFPVSTILI